MKTHEPAFCPNCGDMIDQRPGERRKLYCSEKCRGQYHYKQNKESAAYNIHEYECAYCGKTFVGFGNQKRTYCSRTCYGLSQRKTVIKRQPTAEPLQLRAKALELREAGMPCSKIAKNLYVPESTVWKWVYRYPGGPRTDSGNNETNIAKPTAPEPCGTPRAADAGIDVCLLEEAGIGHIFLVCTPTSFRGKYDHFAGQIPQTLAPFIRSGDVFVFCSRNRYQVSILQWQGDGFALMFRRNEQAKYPWPAFDTLKVVEISRSDLDMMLEYPRFMQRVSGVRTPEIFA